MRHTLLLSVSQKIISTLETDSQSRSFLAVQNDGGRMAFYHHLTDTKKVGTEPTFSLQNKLFKTSESLFNLDTLSLHIGMVRRANKWTTRCVREAKL